MITRIDVRVTTGSASGAGTDGEVYIGVAGREFYIDTTADDFERGSDRTYTCGAGANIKHARFNDPRSPQLDAADVSKFPVYLRFEPVGNDANWNLELVQVTVNPGPGQIGYRALQGSPDLWLGQKYGKLVYLKKSE
jgi:hypothetical protein